MRDGWRTVAVKDLVVRSDDRLGSAIEPTILTCTEGAGLIRQSDKFKKRIAADDTSNYKVVRPGDVVYNPYLLWKGAIAPSQFDETCITSPVYEVLRPVPAVESGYVGLALTSQAAVAKFDSISVGSIERRRRAVIRDVLALTIDLPPLAEQRRIVDLIGAVDDLLKAASALASSLRKSHRAIREEWLSKADDVVRLGHVIVRIDAGRSPDAEDRQPAKGETTVLKVSAVRPGWFDRTQVKVVKDAGVFPTHALVRDGDLLMIRANGNPHLLGVVCITEDSPERCFLSDKTLRVVPDETAVHPVFLMEALMSADSRRQIALCGTGTASMKNISQASIENLMVPLLPPAPQAVFVALTTALRVATRNADREAASLSGLRAALLTSLLSGDRRMSRSYDRFLDGAA
jgi:type I restriction enzyme S subunit